MKLFLSVVSMLALLLVSSCSFNKNEKQYELKAFFDCTALSSKDKGNIEVYFAGGFDNNKVKLILDEKKVFEGCVSTDDLDGVAKFVRLDMRKGGSLKIGVDNSLFEFHEISCMYLIVDLNQDTVKVTGTDTRPVFK